MVLNYRIKLFLWYWVIWLYFCLLYLFVFLLFLCGCNGPESFYGLGPHDKLVRYQSLQVRWAARS